MHPYDNREPFARRIRSSAISWLEAAGLFLVGLLMLSAGLVAGIAIVAGAVLGVYALVGAMFGAMGGGAVWAFRLIAGG